MPLSDIFLRNLKPPVKPTKFQDGGGMYLYATPTGLKSWRFNYRFQGEYKTMTFGQYPLVPLREAREKLFEARKFLDGGVDPAFQKKSLKQAEKEKVKDTFKEIAKEWFDNKKDTLKEAYTSRIWGRIDKDLFPFLADKLISEISAPELLEVHRKIESRGAVVTAHRCLQYCWQIFRYAIATGRATHDVSADLRGALKTAAHSHFSSLKDRKEVGAPLRAIDGYTGNVIVKSALQMAPYVFVRPGEHFDTLNGPRLILS
jgi:hypothetical protein